MVPGHPHSQPGRRLEEGAQQVPLGSATGTEQGRRGKVRGSGRPERMFSRGEENERQGGRGKRAGALQGCRGPGECHATALPWDSLGNHGKGE